jgi:hypothetical protein
MMMRWRSHIASAMVIRADAQMPIKKGSGSLEYYYDNEVIALLAEHNKGAADFVKEIEEPW